MTGRARANRVPRSRPWARLSFTLDDRNALMSAIDTVREAYDYWYTGEEKDGMEREYAALARLEEKVWAADRRQEGRTRQ